MEDNDFVEIEVRPPNLNDTEERKKFLKAIIVKLTQVLVLTMKQSRRIFWNNKCWEYRRINTYLRKQQELKKNGTCTTVAAQQKRHNSAETTARSEGQEFSYRSTASNSQNVSERRRYQKRSVPELTRNWELKDFVHTYANSFETISS